jgi:hypothetical protein
MTESQATTFDRSELDEKRFVALLTKLIDEVGLCCVPVPTFAAVAAAAAARAY